MYVLEGSGLDARLKAVQIKTGISDGVSTEVTEGLEEQQAVITAALTPGASDRSAASNPFSGGGRFRR